METGGDTLEQVLEAVRPAKFEDPLVTADGSERAVVHLRTLETLWFNTGTLCNIECAHCYIESSPQNDRLVYITRNDVVRYLDEIDELGWRVREIGFTGGEPFLNPAMVDMTEECLSRGFEVLILTNAMRPMMRTAVQSGLLSLRDRFGERLTLRVSLDHYEAGRHDWERGEGSFEITLQGVRWLRDSGFNMTIAGRTRWDEDEASLRRGFQKLYDAEQLSLDGFSRHETVLFPEMDVHANVPEITTGCWSILNMSPEDVMCSNSRMIVKRKGAVSPTVVACTLLPYDPQFELGTTLEEASRSVRLNHPHCAKFCVLGGGSCSV